MLVWFGLSVLWFRCWLRLFGWFGGFGFWVYFLMLGLCLGWHWLDASDCMVVVCGILAIAGFRVCVLV